MSRKLPEGRGEAGLWHETERLGKEGHTPPHLAGAACVSRERRTETICPSCLVGVRASGGKSPTASQGEEGDEACLLGDKGEEMR